jgi:glycerate kinase
MPLRVLIVPDKFKGTLTAAQAAEAIAQGWRAVRPEDDLELLPMSDGGDGFGEVMGRSLGAEVQEVETIDAAHRPILAKWWWAPFRRTAIIESAQVIGLAQLPRGLYHPFDLDSYGLGTVLRAVFKRRPAPRHCLVGLGGSATNDGGFGMARSLGWQFFDKSDQPIEKWTDLPRLQRVARPYRPHAFDRILVAVDVKNWLLGAEGATRIFGPQKGLRPEDIKPAERCLRRLACVLAPKSRFVTPPHHVRGSGAAGGLGFGFSVFVGVPLWSGFNLFSAYTHLRQRIKDAGVVVTGEGAVDFSTIALGKGVGRVAAWCRSRRKPCLALAGSVADADRAAPYFSRLLALTPTLTDSASAMGEPARWLAVLAQRAARDFSAPGPNR